MKHEHIKQFEIATEPPAKRVLRKARELIESGWCQGRPHNGLRTKRCASQAIFDATPYHVDGLADVRLAESAELYFIHAIGGEGIPGWNDAPYRTKEEVLAAFDRAIRMVSND